MICPSCKIDKHLIAIERLGIEIDYCCECRGIWLDRGELNNIILKLQQGPLKKEESGLDYIDEAIYSNAYKKVKNDFESRKNNSFLKELFGVHYH